MLDVLDFFWNRFVTFNILEILVAEMMFLYSCPKRKLFIIRYVLSVAACLTWAYFFPSMPDLWRNTKLLRILFSFTKYFSNYVVSTICMCFCFDIDVRVTIANTSAGYAVQHMFSRANNLLGIILSENGIDTSFMSNRLREALFALIVYVIIFFIFAYPAAKEKYHKRHKKGITYISISMVILSIALARFAETTTVQGNISADLYTIAFCIFALIIQFNLKKSLAIEEDNEVMHYLISQKDEQYKLSRETIELINIKCHDLKKKIYDNANAKLSPEDMNDIKNAIEIYDSNMRTGNVVIDTILTEKQLLCKSNNISLTCIGNGRALDFMEDRDIYSLFVNALDNAIEACKKIEDPEKRTISFSISEMGDYTILNEYNYYDGKIERKQNEIVSTKEDDGYHGFGLKSMKLIARKYHGNMIVNITPEIFNVVVSLKK